MTSYITRFSTENHLNGKKTIVGIEFYWVQYPARGQVTRANQASISPLGVLEAGSSCAAFLLNALSWIFCDRFDFFLPPLFSSEAQVERMNPGVVVFRAGDRVRVSLTHGLENLDVLSDLLDPLSRFSVLEGSVVLPMVHHRSTVVISSGLCDLQLAPREHRQSSQAADLLGDFKSSDGTL